jgi:hypothetical protein
MDKNLNIAHAFGMYCKKCKNILRECFTICPDCGVELDRVMCAFQVPKGCLFVYDEGSIPGGNEWVGISEEEYQNMIAAFDHVRPGKDVIS